MRWVGLVLLVALAGCSEPSVESQLEKRIAGASECLELEVILADIVDANEDEKLTSTVALELSEFIMFRASALAEEQFSSASRERCERLAFSLSQALLTP
jgi:hypothetical protein